MKNVTQEKVKHWYLPLISGAILLVAGVYSIAYPSATYLAIMSLFTISFILIGLGEVGFALMDREKGSGWGWTLFYGLITFGIGVWLSMNPVAPEVTPLS